MKRILPYLLVIALAFTFTTYISINDAEAKTTTKVTKWKNGKIKTKTVRKTYAKGEKIKINYKKYNSKGQLNYNKITKRYTYSKDDYISTTTYSNYISKNKKRNWKTKVYKKYSWSDVTKKITTKKNSKLLTTNVTTINYSSGDIDDKTVLSDYITYKGKRSWKTKVYREYFGSDLNKKIEIKRNYKHQTISLTTTNYHWKGYYDKTILSDYKLINNKRAWGKREYREYYNSYLDTKSIVLRNANGINIKTEIWDYDYDTTLDLNYLYSYQYVLRDQNNRVYDNVKHYYDEYGNPDCSEINGVFTCDED